MQWLRDLSVSRKFLYAFGIVCGLCIALGAYTFLIFHGIAAKNADVSENTFPSVIDLANARSAIDTIRRADLDLLLCQAPDCITRKTAERQKAFDAYLSAVKSYEPLISYPGERELYQRFTAAFAQYMETSNRGVQQLTGGNAAGALDVISSDALSMQFAAAT